nr:hypothetical protein AZFZUZMX_AZFZUZMX_CDS_0075 [Caudoviricetes sp.]
MDTLLNNKKKTKVKASAVGQGIRTSETDKVKEQLNPQVFAPDHYDVIPNEETPADIKEILAQNEAIHNRPAPAAVAQAPQQTASPAPKTAPQQTSRPAPSTPQTLQQIAEAQTRAKRERNNPAMQQASAQIDAENKEADKEAEKKAAKEREREAKEAAKAASEAEKAARKEEKRRLKEEKKARVRAKAQAIVKSNKGESDEQTSEQSTPQPAQTTTAAQTTPQPAQPAQSTPQQAQPQQSQSQPAQSTQQTQTAQTAPAQTQPQKTSAQTQTTPQTTAQPQTQSQPQQSQSTTQQSQTDDDNKDDYTFYEDELDNDQDGPNLSNEDSTETQNASKTQPMSYTDMYKLLNPEEADETPEAKARREKKEKRERIARSIADGINAIARIYFGSKGVGIPHDAKNDLTNAYNARQEPMSYTDMYKLLNPEEADETPEAKARREKKEKRERIARSIADGINAIARIYFGSKGVGIPHDAKNDLTNAYNARQDLLRKEFASKHTDWVNGLLKAQALDAQQRKANETLAETIRHNMEMEKNNTRRTDQAGQKISLAQLRLDFDNRKLDSENDYRDAIKDIKEKLANKQIEYWDAQIAIGWYNAKHARKGSGSSQDIAERKAAWDTYNSLLLTDEGRRKIGKIERKLGTANNTNIVFIVNHLNDVDTPASKPQNKPAANKPQSQPRQKTPAQKPQQRAQSKPKTTQKPAQKAVPRQKQNLEQRSRNL